jgi:hypothetical protein
MSQLPLRNAIATFASPFGVDTDARLKAIEEHLAVLSAQLNMRNDDSRFYYNDNVVVYDSTDTIPSEPPIDDILAYDSVDGLTYVADNGAWVPISGLTPNVSSKTSAYTVTATDGLVKCDATSAAFTVTLPTAVGITGKIYIIKKVDASANAITIDGDGSETIDGSATVSLSAQWNKYVLMSDGSNWMVLN